MPLTGLLVPLLTPLTADGALDPAAVAGHVDRLLDLAPLDGVVALGTTGEFADLTADERDEIVAATVEAVRGRVPVVAGIGGLGTTEAIAHAERAVARGADAVLALPPLYWKLDDEGVFRHYAALAQAVPVPLLLYDYPALSGTPLSPSLVARAARELPTAVGVKQSGPELRTTTATVALTRPGRPEFAVLTGAADHLLPALLAGAHGAIAAIGNVDPRPLVQLLEAHRAGDLAEAAARHREVLDLLDIPGLCKPPVLALKAAAAVLGSPLRSVVRTPPTGNLEAIVSAARTHAKRRQAVQ